MCTVAPFRLVRLHLPAPSRCVCVGCVCWCVGCVCAACPRSACRRVGVSACVSACVLVCWFGEIAPYPNIPVFLEKVIIYRGPSPHTSLTFTWYDGFFAGGFWSFFSVFLGYDARACPAKLKPAWTPALKPRLAAAPKAEDTARPGRNHGARLVRPGRFLLSPPGPFLLSPPGPFFFSPGPPAWPRLKRSPAWSEFTSG